MMVIKSPRAGSGLKDRAINTDDQESKSGSGLEDRSLNVNDIEFRGRVGFKRQVLECRVSKVQRTGSRMPTIKIPRSRCGLENK